MDAQCPVIAALAPRDRERLLDRAVPKRLCRKEALHLAGDRDRRVHVVEHGVLKLTARNGSGVESILALAVPGDIVGEIAAVDGLQQPLDAIAATECRVLGLDSDLFIDVISGSAAAALELARAFAARARWMTDTALERGANEVPARLAGRLLDIADLLGRVRHGAVELEMPLAQGDLGRLAGMSRESACKTMRTFKQQGLLDYRGKRLRILRPDVLERIRCAGRA